MPSGKTHRIATLVLALGAFGVENPVRYFLVGGCLAGLVITPDLDQSERRTSLVSVLFYPYGKMFRHRGVSHWPVIGTLTRVAYVLLPLGAVLYSLGVWRPQSLIPEGAWWVLGGLMLADTLHAIMDVLDTERKRLVHKIQKKWRLLLWTKRTN
jgi:uncharacterized metal-binding protein